MATMKTLLDLAPERLSEIPTAVAAVVIPVPSKGKRSGYAWAADAYDTITVRAYGPEGEQLPGDGLTIQAKQFAWKRLDDRRILSGVFNENGPLDEWMVRIDLPLAMGGTIDQSVFSVTVTHA